MQVHTSRCNRRAPKKKPKGGKKAKDTANEWVKQKGRLIPVEGREGERKKKKGGGVKRVNNLAH